MTRALVALVLALVAFSLSRPCAADGRSAVTSGLAARATDNREAARKDFEAAAASADTLAAAEALYQLAEMDEEDLAFASALGRYRASLATAPESRYAPRAETRIDYLRRHAEGGFAPLAELERVRRKHDATAAELDLLAKDADAFPAGPVRVEAWMLCADAYERRLGREDDAIRLFWKVVDDPAADVMTRNQSAEDITDLLVARGDYDGALAAASRVTAFDTQLSAKVTRLARRAKVRLATRVYLAGLVLVAAFSIALGALKGEKGAARPLAAFARVAVPLSIYLGATGGFLASRYDGGSPVPFFGMAGAILGISLLARGWATYGSQARAARVARALACGAAIVAAAFTVLDRIDAAYLDSFGL